MKEHIKHIYQKLTSTDALLLTSFLIIVFNMFYFIVYGVAYDISITFFLLFVWYAVNKYNLYLSIKTLRLNKDAMRVKLKDREDYSEKLLNQIRELCYEINTLTDGLEVLENLNALDTIELQYLDKINTELGEKNIEMKSDLANLTNESKKSIKEINRLNSKINLMNLENKSEINELEYSNHCHKKEIIDLIRKCDVLELEKIYFDSERDLFQYTLGLNEQLKSENNSLKEMLVNENKDISDSRDNNLPKHLNKFNQALSQLGVIFQNDKKD